MKSALRLAAAVTTVLLGSLPVAAQAATYNFSEFNISAGGPTGLGTQLFLSVQDGLPALPANEVLLTFTNAVGIASSITDIYFDNGTTTPPLLSSISIHAQSSGVSFDIGAAPPNVPGWNTLSPVFSADLSGDSNAGAGGASGNGINAAGEYLTLKGTLASGYSLADVVAKIGTSEFRIAMHVQAIDPNGVSASYLVNTEPLYTPPVPEPETWAMLLVGMGLVGLRIRQKMGSASRAIPVN